jgi:hypothetical protein
VNEVTPADFVGFNHDRSPGSVLQRRKAGIILLQSTYEKVIGE